MIQVFKLVLVILIGGWVFNFSFADTNNLKFSADEYETDLGTRTTTAKGNVEIFVEGRHIKSDDLLLMPSENSLKLKGKVWVKQGEIVIESEEAQTEINSSKGSFKNAVLRKGKTLYLEGRDLESLGSDRYRLRQGKISFCMDCPQSWSVFGASIELEIEGYAEIHHAIFQVKDQPVAYFPVFYFPIKQKRQSGFLIPEYKYTDELGSTIMQPYFWAIDQDQDLTATYSFMMEGGHRIANEYRYVYSDRSFVKALTSFNQNLYVPNVNDHRFGVSLDQRLQISQNWVQRFKGEFASDNRYSSNFDKDFENKKMPSLPSKFSLSHQNTWLTSYVQGVVNVDNLPRNIEGNPIHVLPEIRMGLPNLQILGPLSFQSELSHLSLRRSGEDSVDPITSWIRTGDRSTLKSSLFLPHYVFDRVLSESRVETRLDAYRFHNLPAEFDDSAARARVVLEERLSVQVFKVYSTDLGSLKAIKHTWEPIITWGYSPQEAVSDHEFFRQKKDLPEKRLGVHSPKFDIFDPTTDALESELGTSSDAIRLRPHHLASFGFETRLVGSFERNSKRVYERLFLFSLNQDYDIQNQKPDKLYLRAIGAYGGVRGSSEIAINVTKGTANLLNELRWTNRQFTTSVSQSIRPDLERYEGSLLLKFLKPITLSYSATYDALSDVITKQDFQFRYESSSSKCWYASLGVSSEPSRDKPGTYNVGYSPKIGLVINEEGISL